MKKEERILINPQVTDYIDWVGATIIDLEQNPFCRKSYHGKNE